MVFDSGLDTLMVKGGFGGVLEFTSGDYGDDFGLEEPPERINCSYDFYCDCWRKVEYLPNFPTYPTGELFEDVFWKALIADYLGNSLSDSDKDAAASSWREIYATWNTQLHSWDLWQAAQPYINALHLYRTTYHFCISETGYIGLVQKTTRVGDIIYVPYGSKVPFIIRKSDERPGCYRLISQCYIHGMMNGEVLESDAFPTETIQLH
jgi:hypothetical protein